MLNLLTIANFTFFEISRSKIFYNVLFLIIFIVSVSFISAPLAYGVPEQVAIDLGFGATILSMVGISIFLGGQIISKDIENRTIYMVLARVSSRRIYILGRMLGFSYILLINLFLLSTSFIFVYLYFGGTFNKLLLSALIFTFFESLLLFELVVFLSLFLRPVLVVISSLILYAAGNVLEQTKDYSIVKSMTLLKVILNIISFIIPNFSRLNLRDHVLYSQVIDNDYLVGTFFYIVFYSLALYLLIDKIFEKKALD